MIKCIALDLDNTMWDGTLDANDTVRLNHSLVDILRVLYNQGIVLTVVSKNDFTEAYQQLLDFQISDLFYKCYISWDKKHKHIQQISEDLNIGVEHILFVDDSDVELTEALYYLPSLQILNAKNWESLGCLADKDSPVTMETRDRNRIYKILEKRTNLERSMERSDFLKLCEIKIDCSVAEIADYPRVEELLARTNQMNLNKLPLSRAKLLAFSTNPDATIIVVRMKDIFADYGIVGTAVTERIKDALHILYFAVSCKVEGRNVGKHLLQYIIEKNTKDRIIADYIYSQKNEKLRALFVLQGFCLSDGKYVLQEKKISSSALNDKSDYFTIGIQRIIKEITGKSCGVDELITESLDSIAFIMLIAALESEYSVEIELAALEIHNFNTISKISHYLCENVGM